MSKVVNETVYEYKELPENIQEVVKNNEYELLDGFNSINNDLTEIGKDLLNDTFPHAEFNTVMYDLSYNQGSGAVIEFSYDSLNSFVKDFYELYNFLKSKNVDADDKNFDEDFDFSFKCTTSRYGCTKNIIWEIRAYDDRDDDIASLVDMWLYGEDNENFVIIENLQREFTKQSYYYMEHLFDDEDYWLDRWFYIDGREYIEEN